MTMWDPPSYQPEDEPEEEPVSEELEPGEFGPGCPCGCPAEHHSRCWRDGL